MKRGIILLVFLIINLNLASAIVPASISMGKQKVAIVHVYPSYINAPFFIDKQDAVQTVFNDVNNFFKEMSFNQVELVGYDEQQGGIDDFLGSFSLPYVQGECDSTNIYRKVIQALKDSGKEHVLENGLSIILLLEKTLCTGFEGAGEHTSVDIGSSTEPIVISFSTEFISGVKRDKFTIAHEVAHSLGFGHAMYNNCLYEKDISPEDCIDRIEHGDPFDLMGLSNKLSFSNSIILESLGWITEDGQYKIINVNERNLLLSKTFVIRPLSEQSPGLKAIKIPHNLFYNFDSSYAPGYLYIEWRQPIGLDANLPNLDTNVFQGASIRINSRQERYSILFNTFAFGSETLIPNCDANNAYCRSKYTTLPYGSSYTDPSTDTIIKIGFPNTEGLPIIIEKLGRTDFMPPEIGDIKISETADPCAVDIEINPQDKNGISKVEWYQYDFEKNTLLSTVENPPYIYNVNLKKLGLDNNRFFTRVFDNAKLEGGNTRNNYVESQKISLSSHVRKCRGAPPRVIINSPYLDSAYDTKNHEPFYYDDYPTFQYKFDFPAHIRNPIPLTITMMSESGFFISGYSIVYDDIYTGPGTNLYIKSEALLEELKLTEKTIILSPVLDPGKHTLRIAVYEKYEGGPESIILMRINVPPDIPFIRGDSNNNGKVDISDAIRILNYLYMGVGDVACQDAGDTNDDGRIDISDAVYLLNYLFQGNPIKLPDPNNLGEADKTYDKLVCGHSVCKAGKLSYVYGAGEDEGIVDYDCGTICLDDSDADAEHPDGDNPFIKGKNNEIYDYCELNSYTFLRENTCYPNLIYRSARLYDCSALGDFICFEGACRENKCKDSDVTKEEPSGINKFIKGTLSIENEVFTDYCSDANNLIEYFCSRNKQEKRETFFGCSELGNYICQDGACLSIG